MSNNDFSSIKEKTFGQVFDEVLDQYLVLDPKQEDVAYHYTTLSGLKGIIESGQIWASDASFLNDSQEINYAFDLAEEVLEEKKKHASKDKSKLIDKAIKHKKSQNPPEIFIASFSLEKDLLSQWRAYGGDHGSFSIGVSLQDTCHEILGSDESRIVMLLKCVYDKSNQKEMIKSIFDVCWNNYLSEKNSRENLEQTAKTIHSYLTLVATAIKHPAFCEEKECRLIVFSKKRDSHLAEHFRQGQFFLIPYLNLPISGKEHKNLIREVIIGPTPEMNHAIKSIENFLSSKGLSDVAIESSKVPFRRL